MNKDDLIKLGVTDENVIQQIIVLHGQDIEKHKQAIATAQTENEGMKSRLVEAGATIEGFKKFDVAGVQKAADEWRVKAEQAQIEAAKQVAQLKFDYAVDAALGGAKARNAKAVRALLKTEDLKLTEDGQLDGLAHQLEKIKAENDFLFDSDAPAPKLVAGGTAHSAIADAVIVAARKAAGLKVQ